MFFKSANIQNRWIESIENDRNRKQFIYSEKDDWGEDKWKSFHILNCESLESIQIGEYSFSDYAGDFELMNLPQLQSIQIGTIGNKSFNFTYSSLMIRGIYMILNIE